MFHEEHHGGYCCVILYIVLWQFCDKMCQRLSGASDSPTLSDSLAQTTLKVSDSLAQIHIKMFHVKHHGGITVVCQELLNIRI